MLGSFFDIIKTFTRPDRYILSHFNLLQVKKLRTWDGRTYFAPGISEFYTVVKAPREYDIKNLKHGAVVIDIGACIGAFSVMAATKGATVYAFEPNPKVFSYLKKNVQGLKVHVMELGVSDKPGAKKFHIVNGLGSSFTKKEGELVKVECTNLEEIFQINKIKVVDYLKMDAEGAEYEILLSASKEILKKIKEIGMEYHTISGHNSNELIEFLKAQGFIVKTEKKHNGMGLISARR